MEFKRGRSDRWSNYDDKIIEVVNSNPNLKGKWTKIASEVVEEGELSDSDFSLLKTYIFRRFQSEAKPDSGNNRVLVIGDLHEPFCLDGYLAFCKAKYKEYDCNTVVFIGDIIDNHYSSYHETDADGLGGGDELESAISRINKWYQAFPKASVTIGNHDRIIMRKAQTSSIPRKWVKAYKDVLETPGWDFVTDVIIDDVKYIHGEAGTARSRAKADMQSVVQGHLHTQAYVEWVVGAKFKVFGMQVGCGINFSTYAMAYAKAGKKPAIGCGVVLEGKTAINCLMEL